MQQIDVASDRRVQGWLSALKDGSPSAKIVARRGLAHVFEMRGLLAEATDLLTANVVAGAADPDTLRWLARLYAAQGDETRSRQAATEASQLVAARHPIRSQIGPPAGPTRRGRSIGVACALLLVATGVGATVGWIMSLLLDVGGR